MGHGNDAKENYCACACVTSTLGGDVNCKSVITTIVCTRAQFHENDKTTQKTFSENQMVESFELKMLRKPQNEMS